MDITTKSGLTATLTITDGTIEAVEIVAKALRGTQASVSEARGKRGVPDGWYITALGMPLVAITAETAAAVQAAVDASRSPLSVYDGLVCDARSADSRVESAYLRMFDDSTPATRGAWEAAQAEHASAQSAADAYRAEHPEIEVQIAERDAAVRAADAESATRHMWD